jgi:hypothetical protein
LLPNGRVQHSDGTITGKTTCDYPRYAPDGTPKVTATRQQAPEVSGWIESASVTAPANKSFSALYATARVPSQPRREDGQILYFFPGFEDISNVASIVQPVITWAGGQWTVSNWNCCLSGITVQSTPVNISPGDEIVSSITENCRRGRFRAPPGISSAWIRARVRAPRSRKLPVMDRYSTGPSAGRSNLTRGELRGLSQGWP